MQHYTFTPKNNDWKLTASLDSTIILQKDFIIGFKNSLVRLFLPHSQKKALVYANVISPHSEFLNIDDALENMTHILQEVLNIIDFTLQRRSRILSILGCTIYRVEKKQIFELITEIQGNKYDPLIHQEAVNHGLRKIKSIDNKHQFSEALSEYAEGISTESSIYKFFHFFKSIERIAAYHPISEISEICPRCGLESKRKPSVNNKKIKQFFNNSNKGDEYQKCKKLRAMIAHGDQINSLRFIKTIEDCIPTVQRVASDVIKQTIGIDIFPKMQMAVGKQFLRIQGIKDYNKTWFTKSLFRIKSTKFQFTTQYTELDGFELYEGEDRFLIGFPRKKLFRSYRIDKFAWPY